MGVRLDNNKSFSSNQPGIPTKLMLPQPKHSLGASLCVSQSDRVLAVEDKHLLR